MKNTVIKAIKFFVFGAIIGIANIIPGVSGGTMAVVLNVYDRLIKSISNFRKDVLGSIKFLACIGLGAGAGILIFSKIIKRLLETHPLQLNALFIGLIVGSIPLMAQKANIKGGKYIGKLIAFCIGFVIMIGVAYLNKYAGSVGSNVQTEFSLALGIKLFLHSIIAAVAMILPGVSGSLMLVVLGSYFTVLTAISNLNIIILLPVIIGCLVGILFGSKVIGIALEKEEGITFSVILGLVVGSILTLITNLKFEANFGGVVAIIAFLIGALIAIAFGKNAK